MTAHTRAPHLRRPRPGASRWAALAVSLALGACGGGDTPTEVTVVTVTTVTVTPGASTVNAFGVTVQLSAAASGAGGAVVAGKTFAWVSSDPTVATVNASGLVTAVADGSTTVSATTDGISGSATVTVAQSVSSVAVTPATETLTSLGDTVRFDGVAVDANGNAVAGAPLPTWESSDPLIATIDNTGLATAVAFGSVTITATSGTSTGTATLAIALPPPPANLIETWEATSEIFTPVGGGTAVDIIALGETVVFTFRLDFTFTVTDTSPGPPVETDVVNGTYTVIGGTAGVGATLTLTFTGEPDYVLTIDALTATTLTISGANDGYDFNGDGTDTPATVVTVFQIQASAPAQRSLTVTGSGTGTGTITSVPAGISGKFRSQKQRFTRP